MDLSIGNGQGGSRDRRTQLASVSKSETYMAIVIGRDGANR